MEKGIACEHSVTIPSSLGRAMPYGEGAKRVDRHAVGRVNQWLASTSIHGLRRGSPVALMP